MFHEPVWEISAIMKGGEIEARARVCVFVCDKERGLRWIRQACLRKWKPGSSVSIVTMLRLDG
jgi:hypothetical protein